MSNEPGKRPQNPSPAPGDPDPPYRVYRSGQPDRSDPEQRPYTLYRSSPKGLRERLRDPEDAIEDDERRGLGRRSWRRRRRRSDEDRLLEPGGRRRPITPWRVVRWVVMLFVGWLLLSLVLFIISAQINSGSGLPRAARRELASGPNMITGTDTILVLGLDQRPAGSKEPGAFAGGIRSDSIMLWRIGGGTSRRLSIPRDTVADIPGYGESKINAAYAYGGAALAIKTIEQFTQIRTINHVIIVNLANFPKFINAVGGVDVTTGRICSNISGGARNGGFTLDLKPGSHHLNGTQALTLARTRENACDAASNDLTRDAYQQKILNAIKGKLTSPGIIPRLPWTAWDAPQAVRTDMGGPTMLSLFAAAEVGGSAPTDVLKPASSTVLANGGDALVATPAQIHAAVSRLMTGR